MRIRNLRTVPMAIACALLGAFPAWPATAHPHAWIDVTVQVLFDGSGRVTGLREHWLFDESYTVFAMEGLGRTGEGRASQDEIDTRHGENRKNREPPTEER